jgi:hypothetical protein
MKVKLALVGLAALVQMGCSETEVGNTTGQPQAAGESQDNGIMSLQNPPSARPAGESMR